MAWPGWYPYPGIWYGGPYLSFGIGFGIGFFGGFGWGWNHWGFDWGGRYATYGGGRYYSRSNTFYNRSSFNRGGGARAEFPTAATSTEAGGARGGFSNRSGPTARPFNGNTQAARGYAAPRGQSGVRSGAFSGIEKGGQTRSYSSRGSASFGGGGSAWRRWWSVARWWRRRIAWRRWRASLIKVSVMFLIARKIWKWREAICGERS